MNDIIMLPTVSIIIPIYNTEKYLKQCLDSVINQSYNNIEIICVNDGSIDSCGKILELYKKKDSRVCVIERENGGRSAARNSGLLVANGKYVLFLDSDDTYTSNTCELALQSILDNNVDIVCFGTWINGEAWDSDTSYYNIKQNGIVQIDNKLLLEINYSVCNKLFKRDLIENHLLRFPEGMIYEDAAFFLKYIVFCETAYYLKEKLLQYRRGHSTSIMTETKVGTINSLDHLRVIKDIYDFWQEKNILVGRQELLAILFRDYFHASYIYAPKIFRVNTINLAMDILSKSPLIINPLAVLLFGTNYQNIFKNLKINYRKNEFIKQEDLQLLTPILISLLVTKYHGLDNISTSTFEKIKKIINYWKKYGFKITIKNIISKLSGYFKK